MNKSLLLLFFRKEDLSSYGASAGTHRKTTLLSEGAVTLCV
jgi:hypothetical protein